jgi:hypothetical protein
VGPKAPLARESPREQPAREAFREEAKSREGLASPARLAESQDGRWACFAAARNRLGGSRPGRGPRAEPLDHQAFEAEVEDPPYCFLTGIHPGHSSAPVRSSLLPRYPRRPWESAGQA